MGTGERNFASALGLVLIALAVFIAVSLVSYHPADAGHYAGPPGFVSNYGGKLGAQVSLYLFLATGVAAFALPLLLLGEGIARLLSRRPASPVPRFVGHLAVLLSLSSLAALVRPVTPEALGWQLERVGAGGVWGEWTSTYLLKYLGTIGSRLVLVTTAAVAFGYLTAMKPYYFLVAAALGAGRFFASLLPRGRRIVVTPPSRSRPAKAPAKKEAVAPTPAAAARQAEKARAKLQRETLRREAREREKLRKAEEKRRRREEREEEIRRRSRAEKEEQRRRAEAAATVREKQKADLPAAAARAPSRPSGPAAPGKTARYIPPPVELLTPPPPPAPREMKGDVEQNSRLLESTLADFGITAAVVGSERGPAVTRYELQPAPGVKVQKIKTLANDIALAMKAVSVRILAPIPGKAAVGIEIPNSSTSLVYLREMVESREFSSGKKRIPLTVGKDISGRCIVADIAEMPHLLIAGATGSGKTVCVNSLIMSVLYSSTPSDLKLILVDPKKVEMTSFHSLPHLLCPVITDPAKSAQVLAWLVGEMEGRYDLFAEAGVRNIASYNRRRPSSSPPEEGLPETIPYILLIIDELADLMLTAPVEIENAIARLAHLSRAVGIHMVLATQRPSVDVITGVIKANFPARISFKVASKIDSRIVLDAPGADKLLGSGDLLFLPPASDRLIRAQGTMCSDEEIAKVVDYVNSQAAPQYDPEILARPSAAGAVGDEGEADPVLENAIKVIKQTEQASVSILQRKLKIGYSRAARVMDQLEERGIVGPHQGAKPREILIETYGGQSEEGGGED